MKPGDNLSSYKIVAKIGAGGMGEVYHAHDAKLERDVALKILPDEMTQDPVRHARFHREAKLLAAFEAEEQKSKGKSRLPSSPPSQPLVEPLSQREVEVLELIAEGLSNREISERLFLALGTVKGHNRRIYGKLGVKNRTQAINKARSLNILPPQ